MRRSWLVWLLPVLLAWPLLLLFTLSHTGFYGTYTGGVFGPTTPNYVTPLRHNKLITAQQNKLNGAQHAFTIAFSQLILFAQDLGYTVSIGECLRTCGRRGSLHDLRLACDLLLFKDGRYLKGGQDYRHLGAWWIRYGHNYGIPLEWGGSGERGDGNHFSHGWKGRW